MSFDGNANMESAKIDNANTGKVTGDSTKIDNANIGHAIGGSTVTSSPPGTPFSTTTFNTADTAATTPVDGSFPNSSGVAAATQSPIITVERMPYTFEHIMQMGQAVAQARREKKLPATTTPTYNVQAIIDDYEDLQRLNDLRQGSTSNGALRNEFSRLYVEIQRKIQDRDLTHGEVAAEANVRARISGLANGTAAETGFYNLVRHAVNSVLRHNNLSIDSDQNLVESAASRILNEIRATVQGQVARGAHGVDGVNMDSVMEDVFNAIEKTLEERIGVQTSRLGGEINNISDITNDMSCITDAQSMQLDAVAGHVKAIDSHVHAMGNNVNAMGTLLNSTNGNVTALATNIGSLQTIINLLPQMVAAAVQQMIPEVVNEAVRDVVQAAVTREFMGRFELLVRAMQGAQSQNATQNKKRNWFSRINIFKRSGRRDAH